jgi:hypothetical protein
MITLRIAACQSGYAASVEPFRILVVAADDHIDEPLRRELDQRAGDRAPEVRLVVPALAETAFEQAAGAVDEGLAHARESLDESLERMHDAGVEGEGRVGDADPILAIEDALYGFPADEIVIVTHPEHEGRWLEDDLFERAKQRFEPPIHHYVHRNRAVEEVESSGAGVEPSEHAEVDLESRNLPRFTVRDIAGIVVAIVGTIVLIVIAAANPDETGSGFDFDALHTIIAGLFALINIAHIVGLVLFESVGYRGLPQRLFADLSLYGTPVAIAVSLLLLLA